MREKRGVTIIETLVYLALFAIIMSGILAATYSLFESSGRNQARAMLREEKQYIVAKIDYTLRRSAQIISPAQNTGSSELVVLDRNGTTLTIDSVGATMRLNGASLNNSNVKISELRFVRAQDVGTLERVEASFSVETAAPNGMPIIERASTTRFFTYE